MSHRSLAHLIMRLSIGVMLLFALSTCGGSPTSPGKSKTQQPGWFWQNPLPQGNTLRGVSFSDVNTGTAVGSAGTILRTTDGPSATITNATNTGRTVLYIPNSSIML